jgi:hypothetical protein
MEDTFEYDAGEPKQEKEPEKPKRPQVNSIDFIASIEGLTLLKDGGVNLRLGINASECITIAKIMAARSNNQILKVFAEIKEPEQYGGNL